MFETLKPAGTQPVPIDEVPGPVQHATAFGTTPDGQDPTTRSEKQPAVMPTNHGTSSEGEAPEERRSEE